jgi:hypothetical protein
MGNLHKIYSDAIGRVISKEKQEEPFSPAEDATSKQIKINWLQSTTTNQMFSSIGREIEVLIEQAITDACSFHNHGNSQRIIDALIRADQLRKVINKYGDNSTN